MNQGAEKTGNTYRESLFDKYPWAANHNDAITWLTNYMEQSTESIIKEFDDRILQKVAKDHLILSNGYSIS